MKNIIETTPQNIPTFQSSKLNSYTSQIFKQGLNIKKCYMRVCEILAKIDASKCYQADGFESIHEYSEQVLGIKRAQSHHLLRVGRDYVDWKTHETVLAHPEGQDFTTSQVIYMLPLGVEMAKRMTEKGNITPDMTVAEIKEVVSDYKNAKTSDENEGEIVEANATVEAPGTLDNEAIEALNLQSSLELGYDSEGNPVILYGDVLVGVREAKKIISEWMKTDK